MTSARVSYTPHMVQVPLIASQLRRDACGKREASVLALGQPVVVEVVALLRAIRLHGVPATFHRDETDAFEDFHVASDLKSKSVEGAVLK